MRVLLYSSVLYLTGIALILYFRPALMFKQDGRWKEFGLNGDDTTVFPLWLFCIVWAVVVYGLIRILYSDDSSETSIVNSTALAANAVNAANVANVANVANIATANVATAAPSLTERVQEPTEEAKPGYYKLNSALMKKKGIPRYIYVGTEEPDDLD